MKSISVLVFISLVLLALPSFAQVATTSTSTQSGGDAAALSAGTMGLSLGIAGGNPFAAGTAGFTYFFTDSLAGGLSLGLRLENGDDQVAGLDAGPNGGDWGLLIAPNIRYFFRTGHRVSPFLIGKLNIAANDLNNAGNDDEEVYLGLMFGVGAEFFPYDYFSIGGHFGANLNMVEDFGLGFLTSAMHVNFYF